MEWCQYIVITIVYFKIGWKICFSCRSSHIQLRTYSAFIASDIVLASTSDATCVVCSAISFSHVRYIVFRKIKTMLHWFHEGVEYIHYTAVRKVSCCRRNAEAGGVSLY
jgi:hypothetical protein